MFHTPTEFSKSLWAVLFRESDGGETYSESEIIRIYERSASPGLVSRVLQKFGCSLAEILTHSEYFYHVNQGWKIFRHDSSGRLLDKGSRQEMYVPTEHQTPFLDVHHNHSTYSQIYSNGIYLEMVPGVRGYAEYAASPWGSRFERCSALCRPSNAHQERGSPTASKAFDNDGIPSRFDGYQHPAPKRKLPASRVVFGDAREVLKANIATTAQKLPLGKFSVDDLIDEIRSLSNGDRKQVNDMTRFYLFKMNKKQFSLVNESQG